MLQKIKHIFSKIIKEDVFPLNYTCSLCDKEVFNGEDFCQKCSSEIYKIENRCNHCGRKTPYVVNYCSSCIDKNIDFDFARSIYDYLGNIPKIIQSFKYNEKAYLAQIFSKKLKEIYLKEFITADVIIGVPMTEKAKLKRGYNQSELLAKCLSREIGVECNFEICKKVKETERQATLNVLERAKNLQGAFVVYKKDIVGKNVLIVDDVLTTGVTVNNIAKLLKKKGANKVFVLTIASVQKD